MGCIARAPAVAFALGLAGCPLSIDESRLDVHADASIPVDGGDAASTEPDATPDGSVTARCDLSKPFGAAKQLAFNTAGDEFGARFSDDELTVFVHTGLAGNQDIQTASRAAMDKPFGALTVLLPISKPDSDETHFVMSRDGRTCFFSSNRATSQGRDIWRARRDSPGAMWGTPERLTVLASQDNDTDAMLSYDEKRLYFVRYVPSSGSLDLFVSNLDGAFEPDAPIPVSELNTDGYDEQGPALTGDELTMYFTRYPKNGSQPDDMFVTRRTSKSARWGTPQPLTELNTPAIERTTSVSADGCRLHFTSRRTGTVGGNDIFVAEKPPL